MADTILLLGARSRLQPLDAVSEEVRKIKEIFSSAESIQTNIDYEPLLVREVLEKTLLRHTNKVNIIHFAGHSGEDRLMADDGLIYSHHIADILRTWEVKPDVIFLNGCNSSGQVQGFLDAGVSCVIATYNYIDDGLASGFAQTFYENLLANDGSVCLANAFHRAGSSVLFSENRKARSLDIEDLAEMPGAWDWGLFSNAPEFAEQWSLLNQEVTIKQGWSAGSGTDDFGVYAELVVEGVVQCMRRIDGSENIPPFWLADTACTQALWRQIRGDNPSEFNDDEQKPVEQVSWFMTQRFLDELNGLIPGLAARLPNEAEWELACRAGSEYGYAFGDNISLGQANFYAHSTVAVKSFPPNAWGLYEMHGNVWEWCENDADDLGNLKVLRGGSWANEAEAVRSDSRGQSALGNRDYTFGFRFLIPA